MTSNDVAAQLRAHIRDIPDFPKPGILFRDLTPLLADASALALAIDAMAEPFARDGVDSVLGTEARGFIFGAAIAIRLGAGFVPARKPGKLPYRTLDVSYELEYGTDTVQMHVDGVRKGQRVLVTGLRAASITFGAGRAVLSACSSAPLSERRRGATIAAIFS